jgi:hypothetical protein
LGSREVRATAKNAAATVFPEPRYGADKGNTDAVLDGFIDAFLRGRAAGGTLPADTAMSSLGHAAAGGAATRSLVSP